MKQLDDKFQRNKINTRKNYLSQLRGFLLVMIHYISESTNTTKITRGIICKSSTNTNLNTNTALKKTKKKVDFHCFAYPTALKRQLLSEGITLLTITPSMTQIVDNRQPENQS